MKRGWYEKHIPLAERPSNVYSGVPRAFEQCDPHTYERECHIVGMFPYACVE